MMHWKPAFLFALLLIAGLRSVHAAEAGVTMRETLVHDGAQRAYELHLPPVYAEETSLPLVIALHPTSSSGRAMAALTGLNAAADEHGFIAAYPDAHGLTWNEGRDALEGANLDTLADDVGFIAALIAHLAEAYNVDTARVSVVGMGNGGLMVYRLACEIPDRLNAAVVVGSLMWAYHRDNCPDDPAAPVNLLIIHGTNDIYYQNEDNSYIHPILGGPRRDILGVTSTLAVWAERNGCADPSADTNVLEFADCPAGGRLAFYNIQGGGHNWPRAGRRLNQVGLDVTTLAAGFLMGQEDWAMPQPILPGGPPRTFVFYVPSSYDPAQPAPLVIALHGRYGTGAGMAQLTELNTVAEEEGFVVAYPDGLGQNGDTGWSYMHGLAGVPGQAADDTLFLEQLIQDLSADLSIDQARVYVTGWSNGGFMVERLACEAPDRYAAFALVSATGYAGLPTLCAEQRPVSILMMHGTDDNNVPWDGLAQTVDGQQIYLLAPVVNTLAYWGNHSGCSADFEGEELPQSGASPGTSVRILRLKDCAEEAEVVLYAIIGGGHNWPGVPVTGPLAIFGSVNLDIHASRVIWDFFSRHTLGGA